MIKHFLVNSHRGVKGSDPQPCDDANMARPRNQASRRAQLLEAATRAVLDHGSTGTRLRDIAEQAGVTPASVLYYYPDMRELFTAVHERGITTYCEHRERQTGQFEDVTERLRACIRCGVPRAGETERTSRLLYELQSVALRDDTAAAQQRMFIERQTALYQVILEEGERSGHFRLVAPSDVLARGFVALEDGYGMDILTGAATPDDVEQWLLLHANIVTGSRSLTSTPPRQLDPCSTGQTDENPRTVQ